MPFKDPEKYKQYQKEYRMRPENIKRKREVGIEYRSKNKEILSKKSKEKWQNRTDEQKLIDYEYGKKYRKENKDRISKQRRGFWANRPDKKVKAEKDRLKKWRKDNAEVLKTIRQIKRTVLIEMLGGKCARCGATGYLEFDHINPDEKSFLINPSYNMEKLKPELKKCQLLCYPCHMEKTKEDFLNGKIMKDPVDLMKSRDDRHEREF